MRAIILNYAVNAVEVADIPQEVVTDAEENSFSFSERIEEYLTIELGYHIDDITYMFTDDERTPIYKNNADEPIAFI